MDEFKNNAEEPAEEKSNTVYGAENSSTDAVHNAETVEPVNSTPETSNTQTEAASQRPETAEGIARPVNHSEQSGYNYGGYNNGFNNNNNFNNNNYSNYNGNNYNGNNYNGNNNYNNNNYSGNAYNNGYNYNHTYSRFRTPEEEAAYIERQKEIRQKNAAFRKSVAIGIAGAVFFGASLGAGLGIAYNGSRNLFVKSAQPFSFDTANNDKEDKTDDSIAKTSADITPSNDSVTATIDKVDDAIVNISTTERQQSWFNVYESEGAGSGIIYSEDDEKVYIVTNNHVVENASAVNISITGDENIKASLVGKDASSDIAVISVLKSDLKAAGIDKVTVAEFGDSDKVQVGEYVVAIGNALGLGKTTTRGIISAQNKTINIDGKDMTMIQTDAAINPGNSGGALVNSAGQVIGINTAKNSNYAVEGTGFAIPINSAKDVMQQLVEKGTVDKPYLGITGETIDDNFRNIYNLDIYGVFVRSVEQNSAAEEAGIVRTDIITAIDGVEVKDMKTLAAEIAKHKSGDSVTLNIIRNGREKTEVKVTLKNINQQF